MSAPPPPSSNATEPSPPASSSSKATPKPWRTEGLPPEPPEKPKVPTLAPVSFEELPAWTSDDLATAWPAFRASCRALRFRDPWRDACARAGLDADAHGMLLVERLHDR